MIKPSYRVNAIDAPFDAKERLKARGYRWDPALRFWWKEILHSDKDDEQKWLLASLESPATAEFSGADQRVPHDG